MNSFSIRKSSFMELCQTIKSRKDYVVFYKATRYRFLRAAVIQQYIAYAYLLLNIVLALFADAGISRLVVRSINTYYIGFDLVFVLTVGIFYKVYR